MIICLVLVLGSIGLIEWIEKYFLLFFFFKFEKYWFVTYFYLKKNNTWWLQVSKWPFGTLNLYFDGYWPCVIDELFFKFHPSGGGRLPDSLTSTSNPGGLQCNSGCVCHPQQYCESLSSEHCHLTGVLNSWLWRQWGEKVERWFLRSYFGSFIFNWYCTEQTWTPLSFFLIFSTLETAISAVFRTIL